MCFQLDVGAHSLVNLAFERSKQENHHESEVSLGYRVKPFLKDKQTEQTQQQQKTTNNKLKQETLSLPTKRLFFQKAMKKAIP